MSVHAGVLDLREAVDVSLCGGKAAKLAQLLRAGYRVPQGFCLTMEFYRACLEGLSAQLERTARQMASEAEIGHQDRDIFMLTWNELPMILDEAKAPSDWRMVVQARRHERERNAEYKAPDLLREGRAGEVLTEEDHAEDHGEHCSGKVSLYGLGVSSGTVTGKIKVVRSEREVPQLDGSEILVVSVMDPALTPLFPLLRGMIAEMGGVLSHASVLAREYGLPAVVNVQGATQTLRDGDKVELNGSTGTICVLEQARAEHALKAS